jgi:hypothetical protein
VGFRFRSWCKVHLAVTLASAVTLLFMYLALEPHHPCASSTLLGRLAVAAKLQQRLILMAIPHVPHVGVALCLMKVYLKRLFKTDIYNRPVESGPGRHQLFMTKRKKNRKTLIQAKPARVARMLGVLALARQCALAFPNRVGTKLVA